MAWKKIISRILHSISLSYIRLKIRLRRLIGIRRKAPPVSVTNYRAYGNKEKFWLKGRVLKEKFIAPSSENHSILTNLINTIRRFKSSKIAGAKVSAQIGNNIFELESDQEGYFSLDSTLPQPLTENLGEWFEVPVILKKTPWQKNLHIPTKTEALLPQNACFGIISDIDDTIIKTDVTSFFRIRTLYLTLLKNAFTRVAFNQASAFYRALRNGPQQLACTNPFFYVSNSPWNLYDLLLEFLHYNHFPEGPILLRDFGLPYQRFPQEYKGHKYESIARILNTYENLPFVLIGDSAEKDADIYLEIATAFPERIKIIFIRDVLHPKRAARVSRIMADHVHAPVHLVRTYKEAAHIAAEHQLMDTGFFYVLTQGK